MAEETKTSVEHLCEVFGSSKLDHIRNFAIIAHVDHGKTSLADRLLMMSGNLAKADRLGVTLDSLAVERERGITVKAQTASMAVEVEKEWYLLNFVDTPGHVDFSGEVERSLGACDGVLLLVDASQGVEAQTMAHLAAARAAGIRDENIVPVLTKIDLPAADPEMALGQVSDVVGLDPDGAVWTSAKENKGVGDVLEQIVKRIPGPRVREMDGADCFVYDSWYDEYRGAIAVVNVRRGTLRVGDRVRSALSGDEYTVQEVGLLTGVSTVPLKELPGGRVGYLVCGMRHPSEARIGDHLIAGNDRVKEAAKLELSADTASVQRPTVFSSLFPVDDASFDDLVKAVERLRLTDASVTVEREQVPSLGAGLRCGFLGMLHLDVFEQRLRDEFDVNVISTAPSVHYAIRPITSRPASKKSSTPSHPPLLPELPPGAVVVKRLDEFPEDPTSFETFEPVVEAVVVIPSEHLSAAMGILFEARGEQTGATALSDTRMLLRYRLPFQEVLLGLVDRLKSATAGYATFDYTEIGYWPAQVNVVRILLNAKEVPALSFVSHASRADGEARKVLENLRKHIPRQQFEVVLQAAVGRKIFAKARIPPFRKDVLTKSGKTVGGGDKTRKQKLLAKQKAGKSRLKSVANIQLSQEAFHSALRRS